MITTKLKCIVMSGDSASAYAGAIRLDSDEIREGALVVFNIDTKAERHIPCPAGFIAKLLAAIAEVHDSCPRNEATSP